MRWQNVARSIPLTGSWVNLFFKNLFVSPRPFFAVACDPGKSAVHAECHAHAYCTQLVHNVLLGSSSSFATVTRWLRDNHFLNTVVGCGEFSYFLSVLWAMMQYCMAGNNDYIWYHYDCLVSTHRHWISAIIINQDTYNGFCLRAHFSHNRLRSSIDLIYCQSDALMLFFTSACSVS